MPSGKTLFDWCKLDVLLWLLRLYYDDTGRTRPFNDGNQCGTVVPLDSLDPDAFLRIAESSFPYGGGHVEKVFRWLIEGGIAKGRETYAGVRVDADSLSPDKAEAVKTRLENALLPSVPLPNTEHDAEVSDKKRDAFLCHVSEDKAPFVDSLYQGLVAEKLTLFYDTMV